MSVWIEKLLIKNKYSRPGEKNNGVKGIVMHWTATPGASDENEVKFFDGADGGGGRYASAHIFVDRNSATLDIPLNEVAYHSNDHACRVAALKPNANYTSIGIEMCVEKDGTIHPETVARAVKVAAPLCKQFKLDPATRIFRHYDVTGKNCPAPWVANKSLFDKFKKDVATAIKPVVAKPVAKPVAPKPVKPVAKPVTQPSAVVPYPGRVLKYGSTGKDVERIQRAVGASPVDGVFGPGTEVKVKAYQKRMGLVADGIVGQATWNMMF
jgi:N-acetylmuramoyl-L-alanine amidase